MNSTRPLIYLFLCNLAIVFIGLGLFPILPLYAARFGATRAQVGLYLSLTYIAIASGAMLAGRLAEALGARRVFVGAGLLALPALGLLAQATAFWQVVVGTAGLWFAGGVGLALVSTFTALTAASGRRGRSFGVLALASPVGALLGGALVGELIARFGYPVMFAGLGVVWRWAARCRRCARRGRGRLQPRNRSAVRPAAGGPLAACGWARCWWR